MHSTSKLQTVVKKMFFSWLGNPPPVFQETRVCLRWARESGRVMPTPPDNSTSFSMHMRSHSVFYVSLANWYGAKIQRNVTLLQRSKTTIRQPQVPKVKPKLDL